MSRVVVVGGGIGGLGCALFLAPRGHDVTILDRDPADLPMNPAGAWSDWPRRGVPRRRGGAGGQRDVLRDLRLHGRGPGDAGVARSRRLRRGGGCDPGAGAWTAPDRVTLESGVLSMADRSNRLVRLASGVSGIVLLGDSAVCTKPGYGRGVGLALVHARALADVLESAGDDPDVVTRALGEFTSAELEPWYHQAVAGDRCAWPSAGECWPASRWRPSAVPTTTPPSASHAAPRMPSSATPSCGRRTRPSSSSTRRRLLGQS
jgi:hypothetical protein